MSSLRAKISLLAAAVCLPLCAADTGARATIDLLYDYYKSVGGRIRLENVSSLKVSGKVNASVASKDGDKTARQDFELWLARPFMVRFNVRAKGTELIRGWDGYFSWVVIPDGNGGRLIADAAPDIHQGLLYLAVIFDNLYALEQRGFTLEAASDETFEGAAYSALDFKHEKQALEGRVLLDKKTARPAVVRVYPVSGDKRHEGVARLSDWRAVDGVYYPFRVDYAEDGVSQFVLEVENVRPNIAAPKFYFVMPDKDVQWMQAERARKKAEEDAKTFKKADGVSAQ